VYRGKPQPGAAVPHIKLVNVIYFQALSSRVSEDFLKHEREQYQLVNDAALKSGLLDKGRK